MEWVDDVWARVLPEQGVALSGTPVLLVFLGAIVAVTIRPVWRVMRLGVTLVHELGHAGVGVLCGRRFTGFVLRGEPRPGPGRWPPCVAGRPGVVGTGPHGGARASPPRRALGEVAADRGRCARRAGGSRRALVGWSRPAAGTGARRRGRRARRGRLAAPGCRPRRAGGQGQ